MVYEVFVTPIAQEMLKKIRNDIRKKIVYQIGELSEEPEKRGKALTGELSGLWRTHAAGRYRVIYRINEKKNTVEVVGAGIRKEGDKKDVYVLAKKIIRARLL
jgi:mRNA interferase RelE/StbE